MKRRADLRNLAITVLAVLTIFVLATGTLPATAAPLRQIDFVWNPTSGTLSILPGQSGDFNTTLRNNGASDTFNLRVDGLPPGWSVITSPATSLSLATNTQQAFTFRIIVPSNATTGARVDLEVVAQRASNPAAEIVALLTVNVVAATPTNTATTAPPTSTPTPGPVCADGFEGDNNPPAAKAINVNAPQLRAMCPVGDEDWIYFGGVAGKVYTIDVTDMAPGLDLTLGLYNDRGEPIAFNDDFYDRDPANPNPGDIRPRIQSFRIPYDGIYYIKVRDAAGRGGVNFTYIIVLIDESYGPTPTLVPEQCADIFEPDGLPEQARLITSNELQEDHRLCPAADADWVTFFGKAGKRYIMFTDTRRYKGRNTVNGETQAGADTVMVLTDRDGVSIIDVNDDIPGGSTLDSQIEFTPSVDGFYYMQIKNVGDIGGQFIRYDLTLLLCLPGQTNCGRTTAPANQPANPITPNPTGTPDREFDLDRTATPTATNTTTP